jgi:replication factor A1
VTINNIFLISTRYGIDSEILFSSFVKAWQNQKATCKTLLITCRKKTSNDAIFLITEGSKVVAQFTISTSIFKKAKPFRGFVSTKPLTKKAQKEEPIKNPKIKDLKLGMKRIKLKAKVIEISKPNSVFTRLGNYNTVATANVNDETGTIQLPLWNQQINSISVGDTIQVENAHVTVFRGEPQLRVSKGGQLVVIKNGKRMK